MRMSDWSSDVCSSALGVVVRRDHQVLHHLGLFRLQQRGLDLEAPHLALAVQRDRDHAAAGDALDLDGGELGLPLAQARKSVVKGKSVSVRVDIGGRGLLQNKKRKDKENEANQQ